MTFPVAELKRREDFVILLNSRIAHSGDVKLMRRMAALGAIFPLTVGRQQHLYKRRAKRGASRERERGKEREERGVSAHEGDDGGQDAEGGKICAS